MSPIAGAHVNTKSVCQSGAPTGHVISLPSFAQKNKTVKWSVTVFSPDGQLAHMGRGFETFQDVTHGHVLGSEGLRAL